MDTEFSILITYLSQSLSPDEKEKLLQWRTRSPENEALFSEIIQLRLLHQYTTYNTPAETARALSRVQSKIRQRSTGYRLRNFLKYAAVIAIFISLSLLTFRHITAEKYTTFAVAPNESIKKVHLEDGTIVWLSAASELRIPKSFSPTRRKIALTGRAFFDVHKNPQSPFTVVSPFIHIKVIGTSFDLSVDDDGRHVETILVSGKVTLQDNRRQDVFTMSPGEKVVYDSNSDRYSVSTVDANTLTAWYLEQITFENATLREIVNKLSLIYDVNINLESKKLAERRYRYVINREETLKEVLDILTYLAPIRYRIEGDEVFITE